MEANIKSNDKQQTNSQIYSMREAANMKFAYSAQLVQIEDEMNRVKSRWRGTSYFTSNYDKKTNGRFERQKK